MTPVEFATVASAADASIAGNGGRLASGAVLALGDEPVAAGTSVAIRWLDRAATADESPGRVIAPAGPGLWRRAPWPAADALFELDGDRTGTVLAGRGGALRDLILARAETRGLQLVTVAQLDAEVLARAACVILAERCGDALPARAPAVLAASCVLVVPRVDVSFGFEAGLDHLQFEDPDAALTYAEAVSHDAEAFSRMRLWARKAAEQHRSSLVLERLAFDLQALDRGRRPGAPHQA